MKWAIVLMASAAMTSLAHGEAPAKFGEADDAAVIQIKATPTTPSRVRRTVSQFRAAPQPKYSFVGINGECHVDSRVDMSIRVYINGRYVGTMGPFGDIFPLVRDFPEEITDLYAVSADGRFTWSRRVSGSHRSYHWILTP
jgi:hypothetical protein